MFNVSSNKGAHSSEKDLKKKDEEEQNEEDQFGNSCEEGGVEHALEGVDNSQCYGS